MCNLVTSVAVMVFFGPDANAFSTHMADMLHDAPKDSTPEGMIALETSLLSLPGKQD